jgi:drug/metabolite transporter (DMT)-like permease
MLRPVKLITLHRILIATMIAFLGYFGWWQGRRWRLEGETGALLLVIACGLAAAALTWYLTHLERYVHIEPAVRRRGDEDEGTE